MSEVLAPFVAVVGVINPGETVHITGPARQVLVAQGWVPPDAIPTDQDYCAPNVGFSFPGAAGCSSCDQRRRDALVKATGDWMQGFATMIVCVECGNKRCPKASHHDNACTGSNDVNQPGSAYQQVTT